MLWSDHWCSARRGLLLMFPTVDIQFNTLRRDVTTWVAVRPLLWARGPMQGPQCLRNLVEQLM